MSQMKSAGQLGSPGSSLQAPALLLETAAVVPKANRLEMVSSWTAAATSVSTPSVNWTASRGKRGGAAAALRTTVVAAGARDTVPLAACAETADAAADTATAHHEIFIARPGCVGTAERKRRMKGSVT